MAYYSVPPNVSQRSTGNVLVGNVPKYDFNFSLLKSNYTGSLTTRNTYGLKGCIILSYASGDDWGLVVQPPVYQLYSYNLNSHSCGMAELQIQFTTVPSMEDSMSWRKRKAGTNDAFVEFSTLENPSHDFDKDNP